MTIGELVRSSTLVKVVLALWLISTSTMMFTLGRIDSIVNGDLYSHGLQFSLDWAGPYWTMLRMTYILLAIPSVLSGAILVLSIFKRDESRGRVARYVEKTSTSKTPSSLTDNHLLATCPKCKKVFTKPLTMLDFSNGSTKLVNVCPYCSHILGSANRERDLTDVTIGDIREREVTR